MPIGYGDHGSVSVLVQLVTVRMSLTKLFLTFGPAKYTLLLFPLPPGNQVKLVKTNIWGCVGSKGQMTLKKSIYAFMPYPNLGPIDSQIIFHTHQNKSLNNNMSSPNNSLTISD